MTRHLQGDVRELLDGQGTEVTAPDGPSGLAGAAGAECQCSVSGCIGDRWLPGMDGFQVAESIKHGDCQSYTCDDADNQPEDCRRQHRAVYVSDSCQAG